MQRTDIALFSLNNRNINAECVHVIDGDTIECVFDPFTCNHWWQRLIYTWCRMKKMWRYKIRLTGIDTPEMHSQNNDERVKANMARDVVIQRILHHRVRLECGKWDKYGRLLANIHYRSNIFCAWINLNQQLVDEGHAVSYDGGTKQKFKPIKKIS